MKKADVIVVGGGLSGLTLAIHLAQSDISVLVIEKEGYPNHKVCGEYVSNEVRPYLTSLGVPLNSIPTPDITTLQISTRNGKSLTTQLPLGGFGISRFAFDELLYRTALNAGVQFLFDTVTDIYFSADMFTVTTASNTKYRTEIAVGAYGKRALLDKKLDRGFSKQKSPWLGVKCHYTLDDFPENLVALHNFEGGYAGLSKTESGAVNFCYLTTFESFKKQGSIPEFNAKCVVKNPHLADFLGRAKPVFEKPLSIAQISFTEKKPIIDHILMCGDSAGLIHPLCGNGMAMAIHAAKLAGEGIIAYFKDSGADRETLEQRYTQQWQAHFGSRLRMGRHLQRLLLNDTASAIAMHTVANSKKIVRAMIRRTHGKPILV